MRDDDLKYARGASPRPLPGQRTLGVLEKLTLLHVGIFFVVTTWAFGGQADWLIAPLAWWGSLGALITLSALQDREAWRQGAMRPLWWLLPLVMFNALVLLATLNPSFREVQFEGEILLVKQDGRAGLPNSARPALALQALWLFDAIWISCFNLALVIRRRRALRLLLLIAVTNAVVLAVFGTLQKLSGAKGLFFNAVPSPQIAFFSTFVYHNHWGAFMLLMMAACLGLVWHFGRRREARDFFHTPAFAGIIVVLLMAVTVPLSTSRSSSVLSCVLLGTAFVHGMLRLVQKRRSLNESIAPPLLGAAVAVAAAGAAVWMVAGESIVTRVAKTQEQVAEIRTRGSIGQRTELYGNTWRMAKDKLWFGWGMASYPHVFTLYNTQKPTDRLPIFYRDAHSDWLQALAEHGLVGSSLLALCAIVPLRAIGRRRLASPLPAYLLFGCALVVLYAAVEFPFGNIAVVLTWWMCFFAAVQYARLQGGESAASDGGRSDRVVAS